MSSRSHAKWIGLLIALAAAFVLGVFVARKRIPPYDFIDRLLRGGTAVTPHEERPPGIWNPDPDHQGVKGRTELGATGYAGGYEEADGVVDVFRTAGAYEGINLVVSGHAPEARLVDMDGRLLHHWVCEMSRVWPQLTDFPEGYDAFWRRAHVYPNGDLLAIFDGVGLFRLSRDSKRVIWSSQGGEHHDVFVDVDGTVYALSRSERESHPELRLEGPIQEDFISVFSPNGELQGRISILESLLKSDYSSVLATARTKGDILHTNTIERMDGRFAERHPMFAEGNLLISVRNLHTVCVVDPEEERVVWAMSGMWSMQHQPTVLDDGNLLVFDNLGYRGKSRVLEVDPLTQEVLWSYSGTEERPLYSNFLGSCQRLPNGNTLITESTRGRAVEVTRAGEKVWEFVNPERAGKNLELIASLFEAVRLEESYFDEDFRGQLATQ